MSSSYHRCGMVVLAASACLAYLIPCPLRACEDDCVHTWIATLKNPHEPLAYRRTACLKLQEAGPAARPALSALIEALHDEQLGYWAACALRMGGPEVRSRLRSLLVGPTKPDARFRLLASLVLSQQSPYRTLIRALHASEAETRFWSIQTLVQLSHVYTRLKPTVAAELEPVARLDAVPALRSSAAFALVGIDLDAPQTLAALTRVLSDKQIRGPERARAAHLLGTLGSKAQPAEDALVRMLDEPDPVLRFEAAVSLGALSAGGEATLQALRRVASAAARMGYGRVYDAAEHSLSSILGRAVRMRSLTAAHAALERTRQRRQQRVAATQRHAQEHQARVERDLAAFQKEQIETKLRRDENIYGAKMCYGRQAHLDDRAYCLHLATIYQGAAEHWSALGQTEAAHACHDAARRYVSWANWHRAMAGAGDATK